MGLVQYLKDTRGELSHVAWPTRMQTVIFTALVMVLSILVSLYLGIFDYVFTQALGFGIEFIPADPSLQVNELPLPTTTPDGIPTDELPTIKF